MAGEDIEIGMKRFLYQREKIARKTVKKRMTAKEACEELI
jgi:hypothetical protein